MLAASLAACGNSEPADLPAISLVYSPTFDSVCSLFRGGSIKNEWKAELKARQAEFEDLWKITGPQLMATAEALTGKTFPTGKFTARLTLCELPSQSMLGISVNMRYALGSFTQSPVPMRYKVDTLFHELLHKFLAANPVKQSPLLLQHAAEPERTRDHLHLMALQKAVLLTLHEPEALSSIVETDSQLPGAYYKRAWEIVNATDAEYLNYLAEIAQ